MCIIAATGTTMNHETSPSPWRPAQAYAMAVICLLIGLPIGYFIRGSAQASPNPAVIATPAAPAIKTPGGAAPKEMPSIDDMKRMADKRAEPLLAQLKENPTDPVLLNRIGMLYKATHQFEEAAGYFKMALRGDPKNIAIRDDYASCLFYSGHVDGAIEQLEKSLSYEPTHPGTLFNLGIIKWQGKGDVDGAVAVWQKLLETNPNFERKDAVKQLIEQANRSKGQVPAGQKG
jgi:cytochrome c-type biogenesis protein CcmH/NrfG